MCRHRPSAFPAERACARGQSEAHLCVSVSITFFLSISSSVCAGSLAVCAPSQPVTEGWRLPVAPFRTGGSGQGQEESATGNTHTHADTHARTRRHGTRWQPGRSHEEKIVSHACLTRRAQPICSTSLCLLQMRGPCASERVTHIREVHCKSHAVFCELNANLQTPKLKQ